MHLRHDAVQFPVQFINDVAEGDTVDEVLEAVAKSTRWLAECERTSVSLYQPKTQLLQLYAMAGTQTVERGSTQPLDTTLIGHVFRTRQTTIEDEQSALKWTDGTTMVNYGMKSQCIAAIHSGDKCYGTLNLASVRPNVFSSQMVLQVEGVARWIASRLRILEQMEQMRLMAHSCALTGLGNRAALSEKCAALDAESSLDGVVCVVIDLDQFKAANDRFGHAAGDTILIETAERLRAGLPEGSFIARLGGDEFIALLDRESAGNNITVSAETLRHRLCQPVAWEGRHVEIGASVGLAIGAACMENAECLIHAADKAMYAAKSSGGRVVTMTRCGESADELLERDLVEALRENRFSAWFQPVVDIVTGKISGVEALSRWEHRSGLVHGPARFLDPVRRYGLTRAHALSVLRSLEAFAAALPLRVEPLALAVNVGPAELRDSVLLEHIIDWGQSQDQSQITPVVELSEDAEFPSDDPALLRAVESLIKGGLKLSFDDFGTGAGALSRVLDIASDQIKIDRRFVSGIGQSRRCEAVIYTLLELANRLGTDVVAEGIETEEQLAFLRAAGCRHIQGYLFYKPMPLADIIPLLSAPIGSVQSA